MDVVKPIRDLWEGECRNDGLMPWIRLDIACRALGQALIKGLREDWPKLAVIGGALYALAIVATLLGWL